MAKNNLNKKKGRQKPERKTGLDKRAVIKKTLPFFIGIVAISAAYMLLKNAPYFRLDTIEIIDGSRATGLVADDLLKTHKGRNIFDIDIVSLAAHIKNGYPVIKDAIVRKVLPNRLEISIIPRIPIARIQSHIPFPVDRMGMVLSPDIQSGRLPLIIGLSVWLTPRVGEQMKSRQLESAFALIDAIADSTFDAGRDVAKIDVSNYRNISFYLESGIEVKIGGEDFPKRLETLASTLNTPGLDKGNIKYIDLRFKDVVIGPK